MTGPDVLGEAINAYWKNGKAEKIRVWVDNDEDDSLDPGYFFRDFSQMPVLEQYALQLATGKCLDVGAAAGCHSLVLQEWGFDVVAIDNSQLSCDVAKERGVKKVVCADFEDFDEGGFDTIFLLMNGWGLGVTSKGTMTMLQKMAKMLNPGGKIIGDTSDIIYMRPKIKGQQKPPFDNNYYGQIRFDLQWNQHKTSFPWLYPAPDVLEELAKQLELDFEVIIEGDHYDYLVGITKPQ
jgi:hypothetical protein